MPLLDYETALGFPPSGFSDRTHQVNLLLLANGLPATETHADQALPDVSRGFLESHAEHQRLLTDYRCPADRRIEAFLAEHFAEIKAEAGTAMGAGAATGGAGEGLRLPAKTLILSRHGIARELSLPAGGQEFANDYLTSYRIKNGVLHNPRSDRRTTEGTFHITEGGLPIPGDKRAVPKRVFAALFRAAMHSPMDLMTLPFCAAQSTPARTFVSLLLRPLVSPDVPGILPERTMEIRFLCPGHLSAIWILSNRFLATPVIPSSPKMTPASMPSIGPATPAA